MTADIINLKRARKAKAREDKLAEAANNRAKFGRSKVERKLSAAHADHAARELDGAKRVTPNPTAANEGGFQPIADHDDDDLDPGAVS